MPFWMNLLGYRFLKNFVDSPIVHVPYDKIVLALLALVIPLLIGVGIARVKPNWAEKFRKVYYFFIN